MFKTRTRAMFAAAALSALTLPAAAQKYPSGPVRMIVAYSAGGTGDVVGRIVAPKLAELLGQSVVVENRPGASGSIGAHAVATAAPDGLTLLLGQTGEISINQHWLKGLSYDPEKDLQPVALLAVVPLGLVVPAKAPYSDMKGFLAALPKAKLTFASAGSGTPGYFAGEMLKAATHSNLTHVPYKGAGPALNDLLGAHVDLYFSGLPAAMSQVKAKTLKLLAVSSATRASVAPNVPTVAEASGIKAFNFTLWSGIFVPHGTPQAIVTTLNTDINKVLNDPETKKKLAALGAELDPMSVDQFRAFVKTESNKYLGIIKQAGLTPQ